jgi:peroxiredoxin
MKKTVLIICAALALQACAADSKDTAGYTINGKVANTQDASMVKLEEIKDNKLNAIDSVQVGNDGKFTFTGNVPEEAFYRLNFSEKQAVTFVLGNESIQVEADGADQTGDVKVEGSESTDMLRKVDALLADFQVKVASLEQQFALAANNNDQNKQDNLRDQYAELEEANSTRIKQLIDSMGTNIVSLYAVNILNPEVDMPFMEKLAEKFSKEKPDSRYTKEYVDALNKFKEATTGAANSEGPAIGAEAPDIKLSSPEGKVVPLSSLKGKYVLIDFWASWCGPCRKENPNVVRLYNEYKDKDFEIYGVSLDQDKAKWLKAIEKDQLSWVHVSDLKGWQSSAAELYNVTGIPATYLIDKEGKIIARNLRGRALENKLAEILK